MYSHDFNPHDPVVEAQTNEEMRNKLADQEHERLQALLDKEVREQHQSPTDLPSNPLSASSILHIDRPSAPLSTPDLDHKLHGDGGIENRDKLDISDNAPRSHTNLQELNDDLRTKEAASSSEHFTVEHHIPPNSSSPSPSPLSAFYLVDQVDMNSPASACGLCIGDKVLEFGSVTKYNNSPHAIQDEIMANQGKEVKLTVYRVGEGIVTLTLVPQPWSGRGLLGCHLIHFDMAADQDKAKRELFQPQTADTTQ